jgi:hypothetical protein
MYFRDATLAWHGAVDSSERDSMIVQQEACRISLLHRTSDGGAYLPTLFAPRDCGVHE